LNEVRRAPILAVLRPTSIKVVVSLLAATVLGGGGMILYTEYVSFAQPSGPIPVVIAYALCWPVVLIAMTKRGFSHAYDLSLVLWPFGWLALSIYYYMLVSVVDALGRAARNPPQS
jgi:hypothetical protein